MANDSEQRVRIEVVEGTHASLREYAAISIAFDVTEALVVDPSPQLSVGRDLRARPVDVPFRKDYDAEPGNDPTYWATRTDLEDIVMFVAYANGVQVGGAAVIVDAGDMATDGAALLWDLRVTPDFRGQRIGSALLLAAERLARARGATALEVETQDINVPACRFYVRHGFQLHAVNWNAYPSFPTEIQLLWTKSLVE